MSKERVQELLRSKAEREHRDPIELAREFGVLWRELQAARQQSSDWNHRVVLLGQEYAFRKDPVMNLQPNLDPMTPRELRDNYWGAKSSRAQANRELWCLDRKLNCYLSPSGEPLVKNGLLIGDEGGELDG